MLTIIYAHPYEKSFNHAILERVRASLKDKPHTVLDLYADGFNPAIRAEDLALYGEGGTRDQLAMKYMDVLKKTRTLIFIYPVWWGVEPAIVQGFYDKVLLKDFAWHYSADGRLLPLLNIEKTLILSTSEAPSALFSAYFDHYLPEHVFDAVGMSNPEWHNFPGITTSTEEERKAFLDAAAKWAAEAASL